MEKKTKKIKKSTVITAWVLIAFIGLVVLTPKALGWQKERRVSAAINKMVTAASPEDKKAATIEYLDVEKQPILSFRKSSADGRMTPGWCAFVKRIVDHWEAVAYSGQETVTYNGNTYSAYEIYDAVLVIWAEGCLNVPLDI